MKACISILITAAFFLSACQAATPEPIPTQIPSAVPASTSTPLPTSTATLEPTLTPEPSPTPVPLPEMIDQTFSGASLVYSDDFATTDYHAIPQGWEIDQQDAAGVTKDKQFRVQPADTGNWSAAIFYFTKENITPNSGVYFKFKYTGTKEAFTLGFDAVGENGQLIKNGSKGFYSVAMTIENKNIPSAHIIQDTFQGTGYFKGGLKLQEDTWYDVLMGYDTAGNYIIKLWQPENPVKQLLYVRNWEKFPTSYQFISWTSSKRVLWIDDFTVFKFDSINLK